MIHRGYAGREATLDGATLTLAVMGPGYVPSFDDALLDDLVGEISTDDAPGYTRATFPAAWDLEGPSLVVDNDGRLAGVFDLDGATVGGYVVADADGAVVASYVLTSPAPGYDGWAVTFMQGLAEPPDFTDLLARIAQTEADIEGLDRRTVAGVSAADGDYSAEAVADAIAPHLDLGGGGGAGHAVAAFLEDTDAAGGGDSTVPLWRLNTAVPRAAVAGAKVLVTEGDDLGLWTITETGPFTPGATLAPGDVIAPGLSSQGVVAVAVSASGSGSVTGFVFQATEGYADLQGLEGETALRAVQAGAVTDRQFESCAPWGDDHDAKSWSTLKPASFTDGVWIEALVTVTGEGLPASPTDGQTVYQEIATQTADGIGIWDAFEMAVQSTWSASLEQWSHTLFWEHTSTGETAEDFQMSKTAEVWTFTEGVPTRVAVWIDFDSGTGRLLREAPEGAAGELAAADRHWRIIDTKTGPATDIDPSITDDWFIGAGNGSLLIPEVVFRDGPDGAVYASPSAADAFAAGDLAFDDPQANTWTPGPDAATQAGATPPGGVDVVSNVASGRLLGRTSVGSGDSEELTPSAARTLLDVYDTSATDAAIAAAVSALLDGAPGALDTLNELAAALGDDASFAATVTTALAGKVPTSRTIAGLALTADQSASALRTAMSLYTQAEVDAAIAAAIPAIVRPSGDLTSTSSTTLANWSGFSLPVTAGRTYEFEGIAYYTGDSSGDGRLGFTCPAGTLRIAGSALSASASSLPGAVQTSDVVDASGEYLTLGIVNSSRMAATFTGTFECTSSGTLQVQGAQNVSNLNATTFQAFGSRISYTSRAT